MNEREKYNKFVSQSHIRNSEFDKHNTNATRFSNPVMRGNNFVPIEQQRPSTTAELYLNIIAVAIAILTFIGSSWLLELLLPSAVYGGLLILLVCLSLAVTIGYFSKAPLWRLWRKIRSRS